MNQEFAGRQSTQTRIPAIREPLIRKPPAAREEVVPTSLANFTSSFPLPWMRERAEILHRLFTRVENRREQGQSLNKALRRRWYGKQFHTARRIKASIGQASLRKIYYQWVKTGKTPDCIAVRYASALPPVPAEVARSFVLACATEGVTRFSQAFRLTDSKGLSYRRVRTAVPDQVLRVIRETFEARRQAESNIRGLAKQLHGVMHLNRASDAARYRKLGKLADSFIGRREGFGVESPCRDAKASIQSCCAFFNGVLKTAGKRVSRNVS